MTIRHMRIFVCVYRLCSITDAAEHLHMTQPAVTRAIHEIERFYGVKLFDRINHRLRIAPAGSALYEQAVHLIDGFDTMERSLRDWDELGCIRLGSTITLGNFMMPELASRLQKMHPSLQIHVTIANGEQLHQALLESRIDVAIVEHYLNDTQLHIEPFTRDSLILILPPEHPLLALREISLADVARYPLLLRENGSAGRSFLNQTFETHHLPLHPVWESNSTQALVRAVSKGLGISILPRQLVSEELARGMVQTKAVSDDTFERQHFIAWHRQRFLTPSAHDFINLCRQSVSKT